MPRYDDEYDAEYDYDPDDPETYPQGLYADDARETIPCRNCKAEIDEEAEQCPKCGHYVTTEDDTPAGGKSTFWIVLMLLALVAASFWAVGK